MAKKAKARTLTPYKTYKFTGQDPIARKVTEMIAETGTKHSQIKEASGVSTSTVGNWSSGKTKRPQFATVNAVLMALNKELVIANLKR